MLKKNLLVLLITATYILNAQQGTIDSSFATNGKVLISGWMGFCVAVQNDGKIVVGGCTQSSMAVLRFSEDGSLDSTFANGGRFLLNARPFGACATGMAIQADGKIVVQGDEVVNGTSASQGELIRLNTDGVLDLTFGTNGIINLPLINSNFEDYTSEVAIQQDGKIITSGDAHNYHTGVSYLRITRYSANGIPDSTFGVNDLDTVSVGSLPTRFVAGLAIQGDGKILASANNSLIRFDKNGVLDTTFGGSGIIVRNIGFNNEFTCVRIQPDGKSVWGGHFSSSNSYGPYDNFVIARYSENGVPDATFGFAGIYSLQIGQPGSNGYSASVKIQPDGKIILGGSADGYKFAIIRVMSNGILDNSFGNNGIVLSPKFASTNVCPTCGIWDFGYGMDMQSDGKILVAGLVEKYLGAPPVPMAYQLALVRYLNDIDVGIIEHKELPFNVHFYPNPIDDFETIEYSLKENTSVSVELYDINNKLIQTFLKSEKQNSGLQKVTFKFPSGLSAGIYTLNFTAGYTIEKIKVVKY